MILRIITCLFEIRIQMYHDKIMPHSTYRSLNLYKNKTFYRIQYLRHLKSSRDWGLIWRVGHIRCSANAPQPSSSVSEHHFNFSLITATSTMARIMVNEESDDNFPDLAELCRRPNSGNVKGEGAGWKGKNVEESSSKSKGRKTPKATQDEVQAKTEIVGMKRSMVKKRVLNQMSDNPLLRPISRASSELMGEVQEDGNKKAVSDKLKEIRLKASSKVGLGSDQEELEQPVALPRKTAASRSKEYRKVDSKRQPTSTPIFESDEEDFGEESDGLSDFIVNDSTFLEEEDSVIEMPPPRSARRLVKGRRPAKDEDDEEDLDMRMKKLAVDDEPVKKSRKVSVEKHLEDFEDSFSDGQTIPRTKLPNRTQPTASQARKEPIHRQNAPTIAPSSDIEDPFTLRLLVLSLQIDYLKLTDSFSQFTIREQAKKSLQRNTICNTT